MKILNIQNSQQTLVPKKVEAEVGYKNASGKATAVETVKRIDTFERQNKSGDSVTYEPPKKLTKDQISAINRQRAESALSMVTDAVEQNVVNQANQTYVFYNGFEISSNSTDLLVEIFGSLEEALPPPSTTPAGALADISEGGAYSVEAVSDRIMQMATFFAADDPEMLAEMQKAVQKGFEAAGLDLQTGEGMPSITMETYNHVMNRFEALMSEQSESETVE